MLKFGLIGLPLDHSFSKTFFEAKFNRENLPYLYSNYSIKELVNLPLFLNESQLNGFNVTIPHKQNIIPFLNELDEFASNVNAVNTVLVKNEKLYGFNTDIFGFKQSILPLLKAHHTSALILGTGGASKAVEFVLKGLGISTTFVSRTVNSSLITYQELNKDLIGAHLLIVNCTPLGTFPNVDQSPPIPFEFITSQHLMVDLIYNPEQTLFLKKSLAQGAQIKNGLEMLYIQAEKAFEIWTK